ncbi:MAG TPA: ATP-binding protein [Nitrospiraceae bacterium]|jgi:two-component system sensor histidine kinase PilS (NtrC family)
MDEIKVRLKWLMFFRVVVVTLLLGLSIAFQIAKNELVFAYYALIVFTYASTIAYAFALRHLSAPLAVEQFAYAQIGVDLLLETFLVARTEGIGSPFLTLYVITVLCASLILQRRGGLIMAGVSLILFGLVTIVQQRGWAVSLGWFSTDPLAASETLQAYGMHALAVLAVGYLSGTLSEQLKRADQTLVETEQGLSRLQAFHENVVQSIPSGVFTTDVNGRLTWLNRAALDMTGYEPGAVLHHLWWDVFGRKQDEASRAIPASFEVESQRADGSRLVLGMTLSSLTEGAVRVGLVGVFKDLTQVRDLEAEVRRREWFAKIGEMSAGMAHEIRNPLGGMAGALQMLRKEPTLDKDNARLMDIATREATRLNAIVTEFLRYSRPPDLNLKECDLRELVNDTVALIKHDGQLQDAQDLVLHYDNNIPRVQVDPDKMKQVFWNLATNALQAMPAGGRVTIATGCRRVTSGKRSGDIVEVAVQDTGVGIKKEDLNKIFFPFFTTKQDGSGLGLATAQRIVDQHGGWIKVESEEGNGARFAVCLPVEPGSGPRLWHEGLEPWKRF